MKEKNNKLFNADHGVLFVWLVMLVKFGLIGMGVILVMFVLLVVSFGGGAGPKPGGSSLA